MGLVWGDETRTKQGEDVIVWSLRSRAGQGSQQEQGSAVVGR